MERVSPRRQRSTHERVHLNTGREKVHFLRPFRIVKVMIELDSSHCWWSFSTLLDDPTQSARKRRSRFHFFVIVIHFSLFSKSWIKVLLFLGSQRHHLKVIVIILIPGLRNRTVGFFESAPLSGALRPLRRWVLRGLELSLWKTKSWVEMGWTEHRKEAWRIEPLKNTENDF